MLPKGTMAIVVEALANAKFEAYYNELDSKIEESLIKAFTGEHISQERALRIVDKFCKNMRGES